MKFADLLNDLADIAVPSYRQTIFQTIILGLLIGNAKRTISGIFAQFACLFVGTSITQKRFYTLLNSSFIHWTDIRKKLVQLVQPLVGTSGRLLIALDDTSYGKTGRTIHGCAAHFDHAHKANAAAWIFGHCRVVAGLLLFGHGRWACLPFAQQNFVPAEAKSPQKTSPDGRPKKTVMRRRQERQEAWQKTKSGIAARLVNSIRNWFLLPTLVVCDSWFGSYPLLKELRRQLDLPTVHILTRLRISSVLYDLPEATTQTHRGRRRKYGQRLPAVEQLAATLRAEAKTQTMFIYGKLRDCTYSERICVSKALRCRVKVVFIHFKNHRCLSLVTTDCTLTAQEMIEYYSARWKIESAFKELKQELGAIDNQCRKAHAVENHFNFCCLAMSMAWIYALNQSRAPQQHYPGRRAHAFAFADIRRAIARELGHDNLFLTRCPESLKPAVKLIRQYLFGEAA